MQTTLTATTGNIFTTVKICSQVTLITTSILIFVKNLFTILEISFHLVCKSSSLPPISIYNCEQIYLQLLLEVLQQYININLQLSLVTISIFTNIFTTIPRIQFCLSEKMPNRHSSNQHLFEKQQKVQCSYTKEYQYCNKASFLLQLM